MMEMRWLAYDEEETIVPPVSQIRLGEPFQRVMTTKKKLQYRQKIDVTVRAASAGMWDSKSIAETANMQWSEWIDVPTHVDRDMDCP